MTWYDTLTSTPAVIAAGAVGFAALYVGSRPQAKEQAKEVAQAVTQADKPAAKMAQSVRPLSRLGGWDRSYLQGASIMSAPAANLAPPKVRHWTH